MRKGTIENEWRWSWSDDDEEEEEKKNIKNTYGKKRRGDENIKTRIDR